MATPLLTTQQVSDIVNNDSNFDITMFTDQYILDAQRKHIKPFLRPELYDDFIQNYTDAKYVTLLSGEDYTYGSYTYTFEGIKNAIAWFTLLDSLPFLQYQIRNSGVVTNTSELSNPITDVQMEEVKRVCISKANYYLEATKDYLNRNASTYTLWSSTGTRGEIVAGIMLKNKTKYINKKNEEF